MLSKDDLRERFSQLVGRRNTEGVRMTKDLSQLLAFMEYSINKDFQSFTLLSFAICGAGRRKFLLRKQLQTAYSVCTLAEKIQYFGATVEHLIENKETSIRVVQQDWAVDELEVKLLKGIKITKKTAKILLRKLSLDCDHFEIDLSTYLLRKSKKENNVFCFETIEDQEPSTIRLQLTDSSPQKEHLLRKVGENAFKKLIQAMNKRDDSSRQEIRLLKNKPPSSQLDPQQSEVKIQKFETQKSLKVEVEKEPFEGRSLIEELVGDEGGQNTNESVYEYLERKVQEAKGQHWQGKNEKLHRNQLSVLLPAHFNLNDLGAFNQFSPEVKLRDQKLHIYYSKRQNSFKCELVVKGEQNRVVEHLCEAEHEKLWNKQVSESQVKWAISSENACIFYRKQKSIGEWFRERDFLFIRYLFRKGDCHFIVDRSIDNNHFIPFQSIQRGFIHHCIFKVQSIQGGVLLHIDYKVQHEGLLTSEQKKTMALSYLQQYANFQSFTEGFNGFRHNRFALDWEIQEEAQNINNQSFTSISSAVFDQPLENLCEDNDEEESFYSICDQPVQFEVTVEEKEGRKKKKRAAIGEFKEEEIQLDAEGLAVLPKAYLTEFHPTQPVEFEERRRRMNYQHIMLKNDFKIDDKGGIVLVNQAKIAAQNNVIKFIMSTLKKNLFSGKGILNISLPVQIFNIDSNIQRLCESMSLAPDLLEKKACLTQDPVERLKHCLSFALSNSVLYFDIDKPFNPILGQTFQGLIDGCPVYAEQTSHHPPISSVLLIGRGYRVYANLEAKVYVHLNSGEGVNEGLYTIEFDNGDKVLFQTAPGEVSGLAVGDRKYRIKGKMVVVDPKNHLCAVASFQDESGIFSSSKWKFSDQIEGKIWKVSPGYIRNFFSNQKRKEVVSPTKKQIQSELAVISGRWVQKMLIDGVIYYDIRDIPYEMMHYSFPLNSNSNYREDLLYRKLDDVARSQQEKERLQIKQRNDRKFRENHSQLGH